jgi:flagellar basal body-associated protein FliL
MEEQNKQESVQSSGKGGGAMWAIIVVVILAVAGLVFAFTGKKSVLVDTTIVDTTQTADTTTATTTDITTIPPADKKTVYKNGTYTSIGDYNSPGGAEQIKVTVTIADDVVTDATVVSETTSGEQAVRFQDRFISGFKSQVVGKNIVDVSLSRVSGSSLTPQGWNDAIAKIQAQAKV